MQGMAHSDAGVDLPVIDYNMLKCIDNFVEGQTGPSISVNVQT